MIQVDGIFAQGGGGPVIPNFTYTGDYHIVNEGTPDWKIYFTSSGTFTPASNIAVQVQAIGGGGGGNGGNSYQKPRVGGGGGNSMVNEIILEAGIKYPLTIGAGGTGGSAGGAGASGGTTTGFGLTAAGGVVATPVDVFEFNDTSGIRQSGTGGSGGDQRAGTAGQNAGDIDPNIGGGYGGAVGKNGALGQTGGPGNFGSQGGVGTTSTEYVNGGGGGGGGGGYGGGGGGGGWGYSVGKGGAGAPGVIIMRNTRLSA